MKYLFLIGLCIYSSISYSQVYKFKAFQFYMDESGGEKTIKSGDWRGTDILVVVNLDKKKVKTYGENEGDYDMIMLNPPFKNKKNDECLVFHAIDKDGNDCDIVLTVFKDHNPDHWATLRVKYSSIGDLIFRLKKND